jgi:uncharacterized membrane protein YfcA
VLAILVLAGFVAGLVDAIAGGGGLVTVPALLACGLPPEVAIATNKGQAAFGALSSFGSFWLRDAIDRPRAPVGFACGLVGSLAGAAVLLRMRPEPLRPVVIALLLFASAVIVWPRSKGLGVPRADVGPTIPARRAMLGLALVATQLGFYDGFFGPGVGSMLIVAFVLLFHDSLARASANAKVVNLASNLAALALFACRGAILWRVALPMAAANACGAFIGARFAVRHGERLVRPILLAVVAAIVTKMLLDMARSP